MDINIANQIPEESYSLKPDYWIKRPRNDEEKDWHGDQVDWIEGYVKSIDHPHRTLIIDALKKLPSFHSVLEVGVNCGPNLIRIKKEFPHVSLAGIDLNADAIAEGKKLLPDADLRVGNLMTLPWDDGSFDVILADAALMYISPSDIDAVMAELNRVSTGVLIIVERFDESETGVIKNHLWTRNYPLILKKLGYGVQEVKIDEHTWPGSSNWQKYGYVYMGTRKTTKE